MTNDVVDVVVQDTFRRVMLLKGNPVDIACDFRPGCWLTAFVTFSSFTEATRAVEFFHNKRAFKVEFIKQATPSFLTAVTLAESYGWFVCGIRNLSL